MFACLMEIILKKKLPIFNRKAILTCNINSSILFVFYIRNIIKFHVRNIILNLIIFVHMCGADSAPALGAKRVIRFYIRVYH